MPEGVMFYYQGEMLTVYFSNPKACLPVCAADGEVQLAVWGRRKMQAGELPLGGWAALNSIYQGKWNRFMPKPIRLPIAKFMKTDFEGCTHWYDVTAGQWIQGLIAREEGETRIYIVTITPESHTVCHDRWPRIMAG
jgi:hypothetical protein